MLRPMLPMILVLAIPIVPFLLWGGDLDALAHRWTAQESRGWSAIAIVGLLASDIFLPIPSSLVCSAAGWTLDAGPGTIVAWFGLSLGAIIGFALARWIGPPLVGWLAKPADIQRAADLTQRLGPWLLVVGRGIPVIAEASVLFVGMHRMKWRTFLPPVLLSNFGLALAYAAFGRIAKELEWLPLLLAVSIALPVLMAAAFSAWLRRRTTNTERSG
ncbi:TVP38/TMEM64 family protein [Anatilimnocola sp. NA78]|uniref:TVP38/TMEM64 family protein n=1 Tax=Anatilimnocola sp. NA78 TaxID=3415683 RepID=UPI003CE4AB7B